MKKVLAIALSAVMLTAFAGCGSNPDEAPAATSVETTAVQEQTTQENITADIKSQLDEVLSQKKCRGVVQITKGGDVIYRYVDGNDDNGKPLTIDSSLPIGSVSKQFCAACVMLLSDQKKLSVDDTLDKYFSDYRYGKKLTVKNLLDMSSGVPNYDGILQPSMLGANKEDNLSTIKKAILGAELEFEPGNDFKYSNSNYFLLADIVSQVSGVPYHDFLRKNFFEPLEMTHTGFVEEIPGDHEWTSALSKTELMLETTTPGLADGAGDIVSNAADMDKWMHGLSSGKIISTEAYHQMTGNPNPHSTNGYSYGLWKMPFDGFGHTGQIAPSYSAVDYLNTERGVYMFAASNSLSGMSAMESIPYSLLNIVFEKN